MPKDKNGKGEISRLERMRQREETPLLPHNPAPYLTDWLFEIGPGVSGGMGEAALGYRDFAAWQEISGVELMPWEARLLRGLSGEYLAQRHKGEDPACAPPHSGERDEIVAGRARVAKQVDALFGKLKGKRG